MAPLKHARKLLLLITSVLVLCALVQAGNRAPGRYSGVVFFDRWDTCVLISGPYVMYVSENLKSGFRQFAGQAVEVDATDVFQPINPGDGLIRKYNWVGPAPEPQRLVNLDGLELRADSNPARSPGSVLLQIRNNGTVAVRVYTGEIGINLFGSRPTSPLAVSDGRSEAVITRSHLTRRSGLWRSNVNGTISHASFETDKDIPNIVYLEPGASYKVTLTFDLSPGEYQFVLGYGGGVHEEQSLLSNGVSFDVAAETATAAPRRAGT